MPKNTDGDRTGSGNNPLEPEVKRQAWYLLLNRYHWFVLLVAALGWLFDTMDQQLFALAKSPAMRDLLQDPTDENVKIAGTIATSIFLVGWAFGGLLFGALGDRIGRARVMIWTIVVYSICTGLSALSTSPFDFCVYRFLTGLGVGGEFAVGVSLVAEVMPARARPYALGLLQASSTIGNSMAAIITMSLGFMEAGEWFRDMKLMGFEVTSWRIMFAVGTLPALLALFIRRRLKEPDAWLRARDLARQTGDRKFGSYAELFSVPRWRRNAIVGLALGCSGIIGLWGIGFFSYDLLRGVLEARFAAEGLSPEVIRGNTTFWVGIASLLQNAGGFFGMYLFGYVSNWIGRKPTFAICFVAAMLSTALTFSWLNEFHEIFWMIPLMGFCQLSLFGGYAIYFPEIFPTHLRSTGISFCYNVGRVIAAIGPLALAGMTKYIYSVENGYAEGFRWAAVTMCSAFFIGLIALPFAPETRGEPLPD